MPSLQCAAFRAFVTVIPGTWTSTATHWHSAFVTVVTTLFQEMDTHCHAHAAFRRLGYSNSKKWASSTTTPRAEFRENSFVTKDCCIPGNRHRLPCHAVHLDRIRLTMNSEFCKCVLGTHVVWIRTFPGIRPWHIRLALKRALCIVVSTEHYLSTIQHL